MRQSGIVFWLVNTLCVSVITAVLTLVIARESGYLIPPPAAGAGGGARDEEAAGFEFALPGETERRARDLTAGSEPDFAERELPEGAGGGARDEGRGARGAAAPRAAETGAGASVPGGPPAAPPAPPPADAADWAARYEVVTVLPSNDPGKGMAILRDRATGERYYPEVGGTLAGATLTTVRHDGAEFRLAGAGLVLPYRAPDLSIRAPGGATALRIDEFLAEEDQRAAAGPGPADSQPPASPAAAASGSQPAAAPVVQPNAPGSDAPARAEER